jgi:biotin carboxyl carrier protein
MEETERILEVSTEGDRFRVRPVSNDSGSTVHESTVQWTVLGHGRHLFVIDGKPHLARMHRSGAGEYRIDVGGAERIVRAMDEISARANRGQENTRAASGPVEILAPMPGTLIQVMVSDGDPVVRGQALFTMEAMKMQNEITAPMAGVIADLRVEPGQAVEARFRFCRIDP